MCVCVCVCVCYCMCVYVYVLLCIYMVYDIGIRPVIRIAVYPI